MTQARNAKGPAKAATFPDRGSNENGSRMNVQSHIIHPLQAPEPASVTTLASDRDLVNLQEIDDFAGAITSLCMPFESQQLTEGQARSIARQVGLLARQIQQRVEELALTLTVPVRVVEAPR